jgi:hypothetical protein
MGAESNEWLRLERVCLEQADQCDLPAARTAFEELAATYRRLADRIDPAKGGDAGMPPPIRTLVW